MIRGAVLQTLEAHRSIGQKLFENHNIRFSRPNFKNTTKQVLVRLHQLVREEIAATRAGERGDGMPGLGTLAQDSLRQGIFKNGILGTYEPGTDSIVLASQKNTPPIAPSRRKQKPTVTTNTQVRQPMLPPPTHIIYFDGAAKGNPGKAGCGAVLKKIEHDGTETLVEDDRENLEVQTNNVAEYCGMLLALKLATKHNVKNIIIKGDSGLVINQISGKWVSYKPKLTKLQGSARRMLKNFESYQLEWIPRLKNKEADRLANMASKEKKPPKYRCGLSQVRST